MNKGIIAFGSFLLGAAAGFVGATVYIKKKQEKENEIEIDWDEVEDTTPAPVDEEKDEEAQYKFVEKETEEEMDRELELKARRNMEKPSIDDMINNYKSENKVYAIDGDEFGMDENYEVMTCTLSSDGILIDDATVDRLEIEPRVGDITDFINDIQQDVIYIKNEDEEIYYEITKDIRPYAQLKTDLG